MHTVPLAGVRTVFMDGSPKGYAVVGSSGQMFRQPVGDVSAQATELIACSSSANI